MHLLINISSGSGFKIQPNLTDFSIALNSTSCWKPLKRLVHILQIRLQSSQIPGRPEQVGDRDRQYGPRSNSLAGWTLKGRVRRGLQYQKKQRKILSSIFTSTRL